MKKIVILCVMLLVLSNCQEANSGWWLEWQVLPLDDEYKLIQYNFSVDERGEVDTYSGNLLSRKRHPPKTLQHATHQ